MRKALRDHTPGFGFIQLVAAVAIAAILVIAAIPVYRGVRLRAYLAEVRYQSKAWRALAWGYFVEHGTWAGASDAAIGWDNPTSRWWDYGPHQYGPTGAPQESWFVANLKPGVRAEGVAFAQSSYPDYAFVINRNGTPGVVAECGNLPVLKPCDGILPAPTPQQAFLFSDDFNLPDGSSPNPGKWETIILERKPDYPWTPEVPVTIKSGQAWREAPYACETSLYGARGVSASDYEVSARFSMTPGRSTTYDQFREGIAVRLQDAGNYYAVVLRWGHWDSLAVNMYILKVAGGTESFRAGPVGTGLSYLGFSNAELRVAVRGNQIQAWLNGALKFDITDGALPAGGAGLYMMNCTQDSPYGSFYADDFVVKTAP